MEVRRDNHFVPQFYLRGWSDDGKTIVDYSLLVSDSRVPLWNEKKSIKSACVWRDLYTEIDDDSEIDEFERFIAKEIEDPASVVFDKIISNKVINEEDFHILARFVALQAFRTPAGFERLSNSLKTIIPNAIDEVQSEINKKSVADIATMESYHDSGVKGVPFNITIDRGNSTIGIETMVGRPTIISCIRRIVDETYKVLCSYKWGIIKATKDMSFPTSDDPVLCVNYVSNADYEFLGHLGQLGSLIIMPIDNKHLLFTQVGCTGTYKQIQKNREWTTLFTNMIIEHANRHVYCVKKNSYIEKHRKRVVNKEIVNIDKNIHSNWHRIQTDMEKEIMHKKGAFTVKT